MKGRKEPYSAHEMERLLMAGLSFSEIAAKMRVSKRTITRRIQKLREEHGDSWGRPLGGPVPLEQQSPFGTTESIPERLTVEDLRSQSRKTLWYAMRHHDIKTAVTAAVAVTKLGPEFEPPPEIVESDIDQDEFLERIQARIEKLREEEEGGNVH